MFTKKNLEIYENEIFSSYYFSSFSYYNDKRRNVKKVFSVSFSYYVLSFILNHQLSHGTGNINSIQYSRHKKQYIFLVQNNTKLIIEPRDT